MLEKIKEIVSKLFKFDKRFFPERSLSYGLSAILLTYLVRDLEMSLLLRVIYISLLAMLGTYQAYVAINWSDEDNVVILPKARMAIGLFLTVIAIYSLTRPLLAGAYLV